MAASVAEYYLTNYTSCPKQDSFLASWRGLAYPSHTIGLFSVPLQIFTAFCILNKSPVQIGSIKWYLLNSHFWISSVDVVLCILSTPYYFLPAMCGFTVGVFNLFGIPCKWQLVFGGLILLCSMTSMVMLFENRSSSIPENPFRITKTILKCLIYGLNIFIDAFLFAPFIINTPEQEHAKLATLALSPCPTEEFFTGPTFVLTETLDGIYAILNAIVIIYALFFCQLFFHAFCCVYFLYIAPSNSISLQTRKIQQRFFICIVAQTVVPTMFLGFPALLAYISGLSGVLNQSVINGMIITMGAHGIAECVTIIVSYHSYRNYVKKLWRTYRVL